jgi:hypothetical protein
MNFATEVICLITSLGANSDNLATKLDTDFGPLVSLLLNSLLLSSLLNGQWLLAETLHLNLPEHVVSQLRIVVLLRQDLQKFCHWLRQVLKI